MLFAKIVLTTLATAMKQGNLLVLVMLSLVLPIFLFLKIIICTLVDLTYCPEYHHYVRDGYCDGTHNIPKCAFDGGDCCPSEPEEIPYCFFCDGNSCTCHETGLIHCTGTFLSFSDITTVNLNSTSLFTEFCLEDGSAIVIGNGLCEDFLNNLECDYDAGDMVEERTVLPYYIWSVVTHLNFALNFLCAEREGEIY